MILIIFLLIQKQYQLHCQFRHYFNALEFGKRGMVCDFGGEFCGEEKFLTGFFMSFCGVFLATSRGL